MSKHKKRVSIQLKTAIKDGEDTEKNTMRTSGVWMKRGGLDVLRFKEELDEEEISTLITIQAKRVSIKRSGIVSMHQQFHLGEKSENVYYHPHGKIHMETVTNQMMYHTLSDELPARLVIDYTVKLNGQVERKHTLELEFDEEDTE